MEWLGKPLDQRYGVEIGVERSRPRAMTPSRRRQPSSGHVPQSPRRMALWSLELLPISSSSSPTSFISSELSYCSQILTSRATRDAQATKAGPRPPCREEKGPAIRRRLTKRRQGREIRGVVPGIASGSSKPDLLRARSADESHFAADQKQEASPPKWPPP